MPELFPPQDSVAFGRGDAAVTNPGYEPAPHLKLGRVLAPLRDDGILIGSGMSYHDLRSCEDEHQVQSGCSSSRARLSRRMRNDTRAGT